MSNKTIIPIIVLTALIFGGGGFYGGMKYNQSKNSQVDFSAQGGSALGGRDFGNLTPEQMQQRFQQMGVNGGARPRQGSGGQGGGFATGEVISKDDKSITVKTPVLGQNANSSGQGSTKIIFYSSSTEIGKSVSGDAADLEVGKTVTINGSANSDGSITAQSIQIRPEIQPLP